MAPSKNTAVIASLSQRLGVPTQQLAVLEDYPANDVNRFAQVLATVIEREDKLLDRGLRDAVRFIPRPLRSRAMKLLFPHAGDA